MDPVEAFRQQCKVFVGQLNTLFDNACDQLIAINRQISSLQKLPPTQVSKEKEEFYNDGDDDDIIVDASPPAKPSSKRALFQEEEEHSAELIDSSSSSGDDFINDDEPSVASSEEKENSSSIPPPPPLHRSLIPAAATAVSNKRARKTPRRFSPSRVEEAKKADTKAERSGIDLGGRRETKADQEQWQVLRQKPLDVQNRNSWFRSRWGNQLDVFRSGLGNETENNHGPRVLWDDIGSAPEQFDFRSCFKNTKCAFCGAKRTCTWKVTQTVTGNLYYMGVCCALLAKAWKAFQEARATEKRVEEMDRLFGEVQDAHIAKGNYRGGNKK